jgi:hypothetical protein
MFVFPTIATVKSVRVRIRGASVFDCGLLAVIVAEVADNTD